jgi:hypothetical protein
LSSFFLKKLCGKSTPGRNADIVFETKPGRKETEWVILATNGSLAFNTAQSGDCTGRGFCFIGDLQIFGVLTVKISDKIFYLQQSSKVKMLPRKRQKTVGGKSRPLLLLMLCHFLNSVFQASSFSVIRS